MAVQLVHSRPQFYGEPYLEIQPSTTPWLVKNVLPHRGVAFLVGATKAGKSFLAIDMALRVAAGGKVLGQTTRQSGVIYVAAEDPAGCRMRIAAWRRKFRRERDAPFDFYGHGVNLLDQASVDELMDAMDESVARFDEMESSLGLIVIDTLSRCIPGVDENNSQGMSAALLSLQRIGLRMNCLILVLAHFGKAGEERGIRGWSGMDANSDATITLERGDEDPDLRTLTLAKVKNGRDGIQMAFRLEEVELGFDDEDGEPVSSCICSYEGAREIKVKTRRKAMNVPEALVFQIIRRLTDGGRHQPIPEGVAGAKPWHKGLRRMDIANETLGTNFAYEGEKQDTTRKRLDRALQGLSVQGRIRMEQDLIWLV